MPSPPFMLLGSFSNDDSNGKENKHLPSCDYFAIILSCSDCTMLAKYALTRLVCAPVELNKGN